MEDRRRGFQVNLANFSNFDEAEEVSEDPGISKDIAESFSNLLGVDTGLEIAQKGEDPNEATSGSEKCCVTELLGNLSKRPQRSQRQFAKIVDAYSRNQSLIQDLIRKQKSYINSSIGVFKIKSKFVGTFLNKFLESYKYACSELATAYAGINSAISIAINGLKEPLRTFDKEEELLSVKQKAVHQMYPNLELSQSYIVKFLGNLQEKILSKIECLGKTMAITKTSSEIDGFHELASLSSDLILKLKLFNTHFSNFCFATTAAGLQGHFANNDSPSGEQATHQDVIDSNLTVQEFKICLMIQTWFKIFRADLLSSVSQLLSYTNFPGESEIDSSGITQDIKHVNDLISIMYSPEHTVVVYMKTINKIAKFQNENHKRGTSLKNLLHPREYGYFSKKCETQSLEEIGLLQYFKDLDLPYKLRSSLLLDQLNSITFRGNNKIYDCVLCLDILGRIILFSKNAKITKTNSHEGEQYYEFDELVLFFNLVHKSMIMVKEDPGKGHTVSITFPKTDDPKKSATIELLAADDFSRVTEFRENVTKLRTTIRAWSTKEQIQEDRVEY